MPSRREVLRYGSILPLVGFPLSSDAQTAGKYLDHSDIRLARQSSRATLLGNLRYRDPKGVIWKAPKGWTINGASIPRIAWTFAGSPYDWPYRDASIIHDYYCDKMERSWEATHRVFYDAMITSGTSESEALTKYWAVYRAGPRWNDDYRWSGMWPFKVLRQDRGPDAMPISPTPSPPPPSEAEAQAIDMREQQQQRRLLQELQDVTAMAQAGTIELADIPKLTSNQYDIQPYNKPLESWKTERLGR